MHWFLHTANIIYCFCYIVRDVLLLRILAVVAMLTLMVYYAFPPSEQPKDAPPHERVETASPRQLSFERNTTPTPDSEGRSPMWVAIYWNCLFIAINCYWIVIILLERRPPRMTPEQRKLYEYTFHHSCTPRDMLRLLSAAEWKEAHSGEYLLSRGTKPNQLMVIHSGEATVQVDETKMGSLRDGDLVGEMSYLTGRRSVADVVANGSVRYVTWQKETLERLLEQRGELKSAVQGIIGQNLVERISGSFPAVPELSMNVSN